MASQSSGKQNLQYFQPDRLTGMDMFMTSMMTANANETRTAQLRELRRVTGSIEAS